MIMTPIYLDYNATTPVDPRVVNLMLPYFTEHFGNPASANHVWGWSADRAVQKSRQHVADVLNCESSEVFFTSGSTESNNWVLRGLIENHFLNYPNSPFHIITSNAEHNSVTKPLQYLQKLFPIKVDFVPVNPQGIVEIENVKKYIKPETKLMSFIWVNNEIGSVNPIHELSKLARENSILFHTDATQAIGKMPVDLKTTDIDLLSLSSHKMYGPKGVGALVVRRNNRSIQIESLICGGGQEKGLRSGTLNVPGIVGFGEACRIAKLDLANEILSSLQKQRYFWDKLQQNFPGIRLNGSPLSEAFSVEMISQHVSSRSPVNLSVTFPKPFPAGGIQDPQLGVSSGSACSSASLSVSHVLKAIGLTNEEAARTLRFSFGRMTQLEEFDQAINRLLLVFENQNHTDPTLTN